jgi:hypothetical protein
MRFPRPTPALVVAMLALLVALGGTAVATIKATGTATNIVDPTTATRIAKVDAAGKLYVGDGAGPLTVEGAVTASNALPKDFAKLVLATSSGTCFSVGFPSGKALVIRSIFVDVTFPPNPPNAGTYWALRGGKTCSGPDIIAEHPPNIHGGRSITLEPGRTVPASETGISLWIPSSGASFMGAALYVHGYWVPANAVPATSDE